MPRARAPFAVVATVAGLTACASDEAMQARTATASARYVCDDGAGFDIRFTQATREVMTGQRTVPTTRDSAVLVLNGAAPANLEGQPVASGMHYKGDGYDFRGKGDDATLTSPDGTTRTCRSGS